MISPSKQDPAQVESSNFFQRPDVGCSDNATQTTKIWTVLQDVHTLQKLIQSYDITQFFNKASATDDCGLSTIATLARNISQALDEMVRCAPHGQAIKDGDNKPKRSRSPLTNTGFPKRCYKCGVTETPRWRRSSSGCRRLCNVCSLVESKRAIRRHSESKGASVSARSSWSC
ncbi:transcription factor [Fusarium langsethiae]|uniref:Transcription factor n=1 Tax=Fusarium langsethiae TaxID=179993 RepID=A0A0N0DC95_FUSLA|nr:transcription factor [Fusarium langsethiae]